MTPLGVLLTKVELFNWGGDLKTVFNKCYPLHVSRGTDRSYTLVDYNTNSKF